MKKRKILVEKNSGYKEISAYSSIANLKSAKTNNRGRSQSAKSQNLHNLDFSENILKPKNNQTILLNKMQSPNIRFFSRDRSKETCSISPLQLKSFPAEKINNSSIFTPEAINTVIMQQDPQKTTTFFKRTSARSTKDHDNAIFAQLLPEQQQTKPQNTSSMGQQQIVTNHQQICQTTTHSKNSLTRLAFPEKQMHRPFESNIFQETINPRTIINQPVIIQSSSTQIPHQALSDLHAVIDQNHHKTITLNSKCEKKPISDRNATNHRQMFVQMQQQKQKGILQDQFHQNFQQIYQQSPCSAYYQQVPQHISQQIYNNSGICCNHYSHQLSTGQTLGQGITSPQDVTMNQKLIQHNLPINQHNHEYSVNLPFMWPQNNKWMQTMSQNPQQNLHQQSLSQWQYYYQTPTAQNMNFNQQNSKNQSQPNPLQNQTNYKSVKQQSAIAAYNQQDDGKKVLQFTPEMIRDQELLVSTMKQQGISDQMMQHQFDALLNEQRRLLSYVAQFQQQEDTAEVEEPQLPQKRTEKNEKPEWMMHITPSRMSHNKIERTKTQIYAKKQCLKKSQSSEKMNRIIAAQEENYNLKKTEISNQVISPQEMYLRINPHQKMVNWTYSNDHSIPYGYTSSPYGDQQNTPNNAYCQPSSTFNNYIQYSYNIPCNHSYYSHADQEIQAEKYNLSSSNSIDPAHFYQQNKMLTEPSSLLKMRIYKEIICPQKRNNGLQDACTIQEALEALKDSTSRRNLHYMTNLAKKKSIIRLNGTQNPNEIPEDMRLRSPIEITLQSGKEISANGLENTRNLNNLSLRILRSKRANKPIMMEYPRRRHTKTCYRMQAEKENSTVAIAQQQKSHTITQTQNARSIPYDSQNVLTAHHGNNAINQYANASPHYYQMQQCYLNRQNLTDYNGGQGDVVSMQYPNVLNANKIDRAGGDTGEKSDVKETKHINDMQAMQETNSQSEIRTAKTIGGITYLANKPKDGINNLVISPEKLIAYRHLQPPKIF